MNAPVTGPDRADVASLPTADTCAPLTPTTTGVDDHASAHTKFYSPPDQDSPAAGNGYADPALPLTVDRYHLVGELARGGMGVIYRGREPAFLRELAVKTLLATHAHKPEMCRRARTEARITAQLEHPGVVPVHGAGTLPDGRPYFSMTIVRGDTLADLLRDRPDAAADLPRLLKVFERVCQTLAYAHSRGVVHRDVKPGNVLVGSFGAVKVIDWGVAKVLPGSPLELDGPLPDPAADPPAGAAEGTQYGVVMGTVEYMAPEQVRGGTAVDARADVFALGGLLCHLLTGHPPYHADSFPRTLDLAAAADLADARGRLDGCGADAPLVRLAQACLAVDPADRPADAGAVAAALAAYLESDLRRAERDMARFFELTLDLFCIADLSTGRFKRVNDNFTRVLGHPADDLLRRPFITFVHPDDRPATEEVVGQLRAGQPVVRFRNRYRDVRGGYRVFEWMAKEETDEGLVFAIARDVTADPAA